MTDPTGTPAGGPAGGDEEVARLQHEVERLTAENASLAHPRRRIAWRSVASVALMVVAALLLPVAVTAFWAQRTIVDTQQYVQTVGPLADDSAIQAGVTTLVTNQLVEQTDLDSRIAALLPEQAQPLAGPIASGVRSLVERAVGQFLASPQFAALWDQINTRVQQQLIAALSGEDSGAVSIQGSQVVLDTGDIADQVKARLVASGLTFLQNVPVPPAADRQVVLLDSPTVSRAQLAYKLGQPAAQWLIWVVLAMFVGAVLLARRRARAVVVVGVLAVAGAAAIRLAMVFGQDMVTTQLATTPFSAASEVFWTTLTQYLLIAVRALFVLGLLLALLGWFAGSTVSAVRSRQWLSQALRGAGGHAADGPLAPVGAWVARYKNVLRVLVILVAVAVVLLADRVTAGLLVVTLLLALAVLALLEFLAGAAPADAAPAEDAADAGAADGVDVEHAASSTP